LLPSTGRSEYIIITALCMHGHQSHTSGSKGIMRARPGTQSYKLCLPVMPQQQEAAGARPSTAPCNATKCKHACMWNCEVSTGRYLLLTGLVPLKNGQKSEGERPQKVTAPWSGQGGRGSRQSFSPSSACCGAKGEQSLQSPRIGARPAEKAVETFSVKNLLLLCILLANFGAHTYADTLATTVNVFCTYYYCQSSSSRRCGSDLENKMKSEHSLC